jgi:energy-coupling factor transporter ATP-binding protein EcfA2
VKYAHQKGKAKLKFDFYGACSLNILTDAIINYVLERSLGNAYEWLSERRKKERFARLILSDLQAYFQTEGLSAEKQAWLETTLADLLKTYRWPVQEIFARRFDSQQITADLLKTVETQSLSAEEQQLLQSATYKLVEALLITASELRGFYSLWARQATQDRTEILTRLEKLLTRPSTEDAKFEETYRQALARHLNRFEPFGLEKLDDDNSGDLYTAVVSLHASMSWAVHYTEVEKQMRYHYAYGLTAPEHPTKKEMLSETTIQTTKVEDILAQAGRMVLQGPAGSGKTTLLQWLAGQLAKRELPGQLLDWNARVPFFLRLRDYAHQPLPPPEEWLDRTAKNQKGAMPAGWIHRVLQSGRATLLLDGVDELPQAQRPELLEWLQRLLGDFPALRLIVSSRPAALKAEDWQAWVAWAQAENFAQVVLAPLATTQIEQLCERWFQSWQMRHPDDKAETAAGIMRLIRKKPVLLQLARTPLLAAMLCVLYQRGGEYLPTSRAELYGDCVEMLLRKRQKSKKVNLGEFAEFPEAARLPILCELAEWMLSEGYSNLERTPLLARLHKALMPYGAQATAELALRFYHEQTDLLRDDFTAGSYNFPHRTFQSYLAARHIVEEDRIQSLIDHAEADDWREVVILVAALGNKNQRESVYQKLLEKARALAKPAQRKLYLLAGASLESGKPLPPDLQASVQEKLRTCLPPGDADDVALLALAGESLIPHLGAAWWYAEEDLPWLVRTLLQIGGEKVLPQLQEHLRNANQWVERNLQAHDYSAFDGESAMRTVSQELFAGAGDFEPQAYQERILAKLSGFWVTDGGQLPLLAHCQQLRVLSASRLAVKDLKPLANLTRLQWLDLSHTSVKDLRPLANLTHLQSLGLSGTQVQNLRPLANLTHLQSLGLSGTQVQNLRPLANLTHLQTLDLSRTSVEDLRPLANLTRLQTLKLTHTPVQDLQPLANLTHLQSLDLESTQVQDLRPLASLTNLRWLKLKI